MINKDYLKCDSKIKYLAFLFLYILLYVPSFVIYHRKNNWLVCERGIDAQDNGYIFYKYVKNCHKEIKVHYLITKTSKDINKIDKKDVVLFCSFRHLMMCIGCKVQISSHLFGYCPWTSFMFYLRKHKTHNIHVFLQHGITYNNQLGYYKKVCAALDIFVCGASYEQEYICNTLGYTKKEAILTGFARFDNLHSDITNQYLLIMPTWRRYLSKISEDDFKKSTYFKSWISILNSKEIKDACLKANLKAVFYLHLSLQPYSYLFDGLKDIAVIKYGEESVQDLLKKSALLLTDYSSVFFDCIYMNKKVVFYQFDKDEFKQGHYAEGYFNQLDKSVMMVGTTKKELIDLITSNLLNDTNTKIKEIKQFSESFFGIKDNKNCERIYTTIISKL